MANINLPIPEDMHKQLKLQAIKENITLKDYIIQILDEASR
jgi:hypothetical protein